MFHEVINWGSAGVAGQGRPVLAGVVNSPVGPALTEATV